MRTTGKEGISCRDWARNGPARVWLRLHWRICAPASWFRVEAERGWLSKGRREEGLGIHRRAAVRSEGVKGRMRVVSKGTFELALQGEAAVSAKVQDTAPGVLYGTPPGLVRSGDICNVLPGFWAHRRTQGLGGQH